MVEERGGVVENGICIGEDVGLGVRGDDCGGCVGGVVS